MLCVLEKIFIIFLEFKYKLPSQECILSNETSILPPISRRSTSVQHGLDEDAQVLRVYSHGDLALHANAEPGFLRVVNRHVQPKY